MKSTTTILFSSIAILTALSAPVHANTWKTTGTPVKATITVMNAAALTITTVTKPITVGTTSTDPILSATLKNDGADSAIGAAGIAFPAASIKDTGYQICTDDNKNCFLLTTTTDSGKNWVYDYNLKGLKNANALVHGASITASLYAKTAPTTAGAYSLTLTPQSWIN